MKPLQVTVYRRQGQCFPLLDGCAAQSTDEVVVSRQVCRGSEVDASDWTGVFLGEVDPDLTGGFFGVGVVCCAG